MNPNASIPSGTATLKDLARIKDRAELVNGRVVILGLLGHLPAQVAGKILIALGDHVESTGRGGAYPSRLGYAIPLLPSGRQSFSPNVSYYDGPLPANPMDFIPGPPTLAVEVRGEADYGIVTDDRWAAKRGDYFLAGTLVVWDVDTLARLVRSYRADAPDQPACFAAGQIADAEPAVPGWRIEVARIFA